RYEEVLSPGTGDATGERASALSIDGIEPRSLPSRDRVAVIVRQGQDREAFSLVNLVGIGGGHWAAPLAKGPDPLGSLAVQIHTCRPVAHAWWASPDRGDLNARSLDITVTRHDEEWGISFTLPYLDYWSMIVLEYQE
ncbi:MAG: hypothetical protein KBH93_02580, partial [Anaerolineae bacterium]|nr:hypothetical protein [Anaerolineae bacterium]